MRTVRVIDYARFLLLALALSSLFVGSANAQVTGCSRLAVQCINSQGLIPLPQPAMLGPANAQGAVVWMHGRSLDDEDMKAPSPPYMSRLHGWDHFRINRPRATDGDLDVDANIAVQMVHLLHQQGYRHVVLAGQSFGGFIAVMAAGRSNEIDAIIATSPAAYGTAQSNPYGWQSNATRLYQELAKVRSNTRVLLFFFAGDEFDPGGRGPASDAILRRNGVPHIVVDHPRGYSTHWAASYHYFADGYEVCLNSFIAGDAAAAAACR